MASTAHRENHTEQVPREPARPRSRSSRLAIAPAALLVLAVLAAGCGGPSSPSLAGGGSSSLLGKFEAYSSCMRRHRIADFPDPTTSPGGGIAFQINGGPGSDLNRNNPTLRAADKACRGLLPGAGHASTPLTGRRIAAEVLWARCMRSHGLPDFPDPNSQGAFDSSRFDETTPAFRAASNACKSLQPSGPTVAVPGRG